MKTSEQPIEWPTLLLLVATYLLWALGTTWLSTVAPLLGVIATGIAIAQFCSLQHEALHGHPLRNRLFNEALVFPSLALTVPYRRFMTTHLAHHHDPALTDPYDDPESNYLDPAVWPRLPRALQILMRANNTLLGRIAIGPILGNALWLKSEARAFLSNKTGARLAWALHGLGLFLVIAWLWFAPMSGWAYIAAAYIGHGLLKIRTYLEHRAHEVARARTVIIEDRGPLALLFLNNNFHAVHHCQPNAPWYQLPALYAAKRDDYLRRNEGYVYRSYGQIFRSYLLRAKDPVVHPHWPFLR